MGIIGISDYPNIHKYMWAYTNHYEVYVGSYMFNQGIKVMYLGFYHGCVSNRIKAVYK